MTNTTATATANKMTQETLATMKAILDRFQQLEIDLQVARTDRMTMGMQLIQMRHLIDFDVLSSFEDLDFIHDMCGINAHSPFNAEDFTDCFSPRCSR